MSCKLKSEIVFKLTLVCSKEKEKTEFVFYYFKSRRNDLQCGGHSCTHALAGLTFSRLSFSTVLLRLVQNKLEDFSSKAVYFIILKDKININTTFYLDEIPIEL